MLLPRLYSLATDAATVLNEHPALYPLAPLAIYLFYAFFLDPLRNIPGPTLARHIPGWLAYYSFLDRSEEAILVAHHRYGDVVRIGPKTVIAGSPDAVTKVLGYNQNYLVKHADYDALVVHRPSIFSETQKSRHAVKRRIAAHAYSMNTVTNLEAFVQAHIVLFLQTMDKFARNGEIVEITKWFKFYAFDVIGDLAFGNSFNMLKNGIDDEFVEKISDGIDYTFVLFLLPSFTRPIINSFVRWLPFKRFKKLRDGFAFVRRETKQLVTNRWEKRQSSSGLRQDILGALIEAVDPTTGQKLEFEDLATNASTNVIAGSDTITISLTAILFHLLQHPGAVSHLKAEIRDSSLDVSAAFKDISRLPYLDACIKEGMRLTSAFSGPMPRVSPEGGVTIANTFIPEGTIINVMQCQIHKDSRIFPHADDFQPQRWLGETKHLDKYFLGFSTGPRSCIGRNIALLEMKKLLFCLFRNYDICLAQPDVELICRRYLITKTLSPVFIKLTRITDTPTTR